MKAIFLELSLWFMYIVPSFYFDAVGFEYTYKLFIMCFSFSLGSQTSEQELFLDTKIFEKGL